MAKKKRNSKLDNNNDRILADEKFKIILGIFTIFLSAFLTLSFISYFFTWKADQSFEWSRVISESSIVVENWTGKAGAHFSNLFINKWFGLASFVIPFILLIIGMRFFKIKILPLKKVLKTSLTGMILLSILLGFIFSNSTGYLGSGLGGNHGYQISLWLSSLIGKVGTAFLLSFAIICFVILSFDNFLKYLIELFKQAINIKEHKPKDTEKNVYTHTNDSISKDDKSTSDDDMIIENTLDNDEDISEKEVNDKKDNLENEKNNKKEDIELTIEERKEVENSNINNQKFDDYDPTLDLSDYKLPSIDILNNYEATHNQKIINREEVIENKNRIVETLANYKIRIDKIKATIGPTVTLYEIIPAPGIRISKIKNLEDDIALSLAALGIRIIAPIPGRGTIGIEVPNQTPEIVSMRSVLTSKKFRESKFALCIALGKTISNETYIFDLAKMPHLLIAGATGQGKSVGLNTIIASLLYKKHPSQLKFVLIDPKKVELNLYSTIEKHFLAKLPDTEEAIVTETHDVINTLNSLCIEMDRRYNLLKLAHIRNIKEYNEKFIARKLNPEKGHRYLPYIVVVIDEFADLIMTAGKEIEGPITRLAQLARAIGIHLIIATQRPSTNIITGTIKANFPARIAFRVTSMVDSRTILDSPGANQLIGRGDMLISTGSDLTRLQCAFIDTPELEKISDYIASQQSYPSALLLPEYEADETPKAGSVDLSKRDVLFEDAAKMIVRNQQGSTSLIQRKFSIGYNRAGRIIDQLEAANIVGQFEGSKARQVLFPDEYSLEQYLNDFLNN
ncbi:MAG: DNA translocase FtsK [Bacteroidales bacterium]|jgi:S-DNA-T family DNA segregation ATPase FtsK/SpoIIIE|nr:DNA translocase FtsK [Bacteroidales bacterium]